jgi:HAD superfamily hydrolase (TIGR01509 family)
LAFEACTELINELLEKHGVDKKYTVDELLEDFVGYNFRRMLEALKPKFNISMTEDELNANVDRELGAVTAKLSEKCQPCDNVIDQLEWMKKEGYPMAVVSTSAKSRVLASLKKCNLDQYFPDDKVFSAATSMEKPSSKPDPAIYNFACEKLGVDNEDCVTVEDSVSGATAAKNAGIPLIGYVGIYGVEDGPEKEKQMAERLKKECNAKSIMYDWDNFKHSLKEIEESS